MDPGHKRKVTIGVALATAGLLVVAFVGAFASTLFKYIDLPADAAVPRVAFAIRWLALPGVCLLVGIWAAARRGFYADAIDGTRTPANRALEINLRYNQNTLEQVVLVIIAWPALALTVPHDRLVYIPAMAALFGFGRLTFWVGYAIYPVARAFGMVLTVLPTIAAYVWLVRLSL